MLRTELASCRLEPTAWGKPTFLRDKEVAMPKTAAIIAALDTKSVEAQLLRDTIAARGVAPLMIDIGVLGDPGIPADVSRANVAAAAGEDIEALRASQDKARAMAVMTRGAAIIARHLFDSGGFDGIIGIGGSAGTTIATSAMRALPVGIPKLMVSTVASGDTRPYV
jgi:uncharacterized protein (UPF0261 family)